MSEVGTKIQLGPFGEEEILRFLPHRPPFLFVDRILEVIPGIDPETKKITPIGTVARGLKKFTEREDFFRGHFPGYPITPGVIVTESAGQIGTFVFYPFMKNPVLKGSDGEPLKLAGVNNARFRRPVFPGDEIEATVTIKRNRNSLWFFDCLVKVNNEVVADCELLANFSLNQDVGSRP